MRYDEKRLDYQLIFQSLYSDTTSEGKSPRTIKYTNSILSTAFKQAVKWRLLPRNPVKDVQLPRQKRKEVKVLTASRTRHARPIGITAPKRRLIPDPVSEGASTRLLHTLLLVERQPS